jgi:hypothetical protein
MIKVSSLDEPRAWLGIGLYTLLGIPVLYGVWRTLIPTYKELGEASGESLNKSEPVLLNKTGCGSNTKYENKDDKDQISTTTSNTTSKNDVEWHVTVEHYLLSLVWLVVPFIPASGIKYMYIYMNIYIYIYIYVYVFICECMYIHIYMHV